VVVAVAVAVVVAAAAVVVAAAAVVVAVVLVVAVVVTRREAGGGVGTMDVPLWSEYTAVHECTDCIARAKDLSLALYVVGAMWRSD
jgi:hypothetical protein